MHKQSPVMADRALMRDLVALQRSRSLRDPLASPRSWHSSSIVDLLTKNGDYDGLVLEGRRSVGSSDRRKGSRRKSSRSSNLVDSRVSMVEAGVVDNGVSPMLNEPFRNHTRNDRNGKDLGNDANIKEKVKHKTLSEQLSYAPVVSDEMASPDGCSRKDRAMEDVEVEVEIHGYSNGAKKARRRKFRGSRRARATPCSRDVDNGGNKEMLVTSNFNVQCPTLRPRREYHVEDVDVDVDENVTRAPRNGCGIPWNWSRIHHRGKTFLDIAGRSLSCGLSESRLRKVNSNGRHIPELPMSSDQMSSFRKSDADVLPLLVEAAGSQDSPSNVGWLHDYSGELGLFADNLLAQDVDSDLASEPRSEEQHGGNRNNTRHQSLTQKYTPTTFNNLVGQSLVVQALTNAVTKRRVGSLYVFYGPHGTGKTSCARIFARALNCRSQDQHPKPCGFCSSCVSYEMGKSRDIKEIGSVGKFSFEKILDLLDNPYRVFIFDDCNNLSPECWSGVSKVIDRAPPRRRVVFVVVCSSLDVLPHTLVSRSQKVFFPKLKDADIVHTLKRIASNEDIEVENDAMKLIASRSDGSLRNAEMTLDQLSLLGQRISVPLVQELVGLISDEKLVDLLDLALSADTVNTVKSLRVIIETGVEPLALMSQLATVITDMLAGSYDFSTERSRRKFFRQPPSSKEDMEKLRQALRTLSEAEKQLRMSNDKLTWLTAALLQLAPDQHYMSRSTSADGSPMRVDNAGRVPRVVGLSEKGVGVEVETQLTDMIRVGGRKEIEEIWLAVLEIIDINDLKTFMFREADLLSISFDEAPTVLLIFSSPATKSTAEKFRGHIFKAFETFFGSRVTMEFRSEPMKDTSTVYNTPLALPISRGGSTPQVSPEAPERHESGRGEIVEISAGEPRDSENIDNMEADRRGSDITVPHKKPTGASSPERQKLGRPNRDMSVVRSKMSLENVLEQTEGRTRRNGWSNRKAVSIAEKLEQENMKLEPSSRSLLCWRASRVALHKHSRLKTMDQKPRSLLKLVACGNCLFYRSPSLDKNSFGQVDQSVVGRLECN